MFHTPRAGLKIAKRADPKRTWTLYLMAAAGWLIAAALTGTGVFAI